MWLSWNAAAIAALGLACLSGAARRGRWTRPSLAAAVAWEAAVILALYALWQWAAGLAVTRATGAVGHGLWVWHVEQFLRLPSELSVQRLVLPHPRLVEAMNGFYAIVHVPALIIFLIWLFVRQRSQYPQWRNVGALVTGVSLIIQMIPVAPPRLLPGLGFVDTAVRYGESVYGPGGIRIAPQLAAMPSVHVAWAVFIAVAVICTTSSRWRWLVVAHPVLTTVAVVATANHWWLDGIVGAALVPLAYGAERWVRSTVRRIAPPSAAARQIHAGTDERVDEVISPRDRVLPRP